MFVRVYIKPRVPIDGPLPLTLETLQIYSITTIQFRSPLTSMYSTTLSLSSWNSTVDNLRCFCLRAGGGCLRSSEGLGQPALRHDTSSGQRQRSPSGLVQERYEAGVQVINHTDNVRTFSSKTVNLV